VAERNTNSLIVTASAANMKRVRELVKKMDVTDAGTVATRKFVLKHAQADQILRTLQQLVRPIEQTRRRSRNQRMRNMPPITVTAQPETSSIMVYRDGTYGRVPIAEVANRKYRMDTALLKLAAPLAC